ncbi:MAG: PKD domain-containing protein [Candidatus Paceibacterota bacterium]|jgi:hypothetical protein
MENFINTNKHALFLGIVSIFASFVFLTPSYAHAGNFFGDLWGDITNGAGDVAQGVADVAGDVWKGGGQVLTQVGQTTGDVWNAGSNIAGDVWKGSGQAITQVGSWGGDVWNGAGQVATQVGNWGGDVWKGSGQAITQVGSWGGDVWNGAGQVVTQVGSFGGDVWNAGSNFFGDLTNWGGGSSQVATAGWTNTNTSSYSNSNSNGSNYQNNSNGTCANGTLSADEAVSAFQSGTITVSFNKINSSQAETTITNNTGCQLPAVVWSFKVYDNVTFDTQRQFNNSGTIIVAPHSSRTVVTPLAPCLTQVDALYDSGNVGTSRLFKGIIFGTDGRSFNSIPSAQGQFCTDVPPPPPTPNPLYISCSANPSSVQIGNTINWSANASGGSGNYTYSWSGTDGLSGSSQAISKNYSNVGSKNASVTVTSGTQSATANCYGNVYQVQDYNYYYGGGYNTYYYPYNYNYNYSYNEALSGSCSAGVSNTSIGSTVTWTATAMGGNGFFTYYWYGDENLSSNSQYVPKVYSYGGTKNATLTITSNGQSITRTCSVNVGQVLAYSETNPLVSSVYLSQIPYTGAGDILKVLLFITALTLWSGLIAYSSLKRREKHHQMYPTGDTKHEDNSKIITDIEMKD